MLDIIDCPLYNLPKNRLSENKKNAVFYKKQSALNANCFL